MEYRIGTIIYSRLSSKRLPNKALIRINEVSLIQHVINSSKKINSDYHIIATSNKPEDSVFEEIAKKNDIEIIRGDLENVAQRTIDCINTYNLDYFVRINGDSPIIPYSLINDALKTIGEIDEPDMITNIFPRSFPYGYSVEIIKASTFKNNFSVFIKDHYEHITKFFYENHLQLTIKNILNNKSSDGKIELTVDDEKSLKMIQEVFKMHPNIQSYTLDEILKLYKTVRP